MKWKIEYETHSEYLDPKDVQLTMFNCKLVNHRTTARKIFNGANKTVCAWIQCENVFIANSAASRILLDSKLLTYNPRITPNWVFEQRNADNEYFKEIRSLNRNLYTN